MGVRLDALPDYLAQWKVPFFLYPDWQTRSRSSGDFVEVMAVGTHHTASSATPERDLGWMYRNSPDRPIGGGLLDRTGLFTLGSVRATNTQGRGGPYLTSRGVIPKDAGNTRIFSIEAANNGIGEQWPTSQIESYHRLCCALIECISETTPGPALQVGDILAHFEWAPGRKFDPAGNSPYAPGGALWNMDDFRRDVYTTLHPPAPLTPLPTSETDMPAVLDVDGDYYIVDGFRKRHLPHPGPEGLAGDWRLAEMLITMEKQGYRFAGTREGVPQPFKIVDSMRPMFEALPVA